MRKCVVAGLAILTALCFTLPAQANAQAVFVGADRMQIRDLGGGVLVNGKRGAHVELVDGDIVQLGGVQWIVHRRR